MGPAVGPAVGPRILRSGATPVEHLDLDDLAAVIEDFNVFIRPATGERTGLTTLWVLHSHRRRTGHPTSITQLVTRLERDGLSSAGRTQRIGAPCW
jgi:hypothetical protein